VYSSGIIIKQGRDQPTIYIVLAKYLIVTHGEDVNAECGRHWSPLHAASHQGHADVVCLLLDHGANVNSRKGFRRIPLRIAYDRRHIEAMRVLLEHGADVDMQMDNIFGTLLHDASYHGQAEIVHLLLRHNANVNARSLWKKTPLHFASEEGHTKVVRLLLECGADVHAKDGSNDTPLANATQNEHHDIVQLLLEHDLGQGRGATINAA
jgi:ankyrin repeat protein